MKPSELPNSLRIYLAQRNNSVTQDDLIEAALITDRFESLLDKMQGHFQGWRDGQLKNQIPYECLKSLVINLAADDIINWKNVPKIPITQKQDRDIDQETEDWDENPIF